VRIRGVVEQKGRRRYKGRSRPTRIGSSQHFYRTVEGKNLLMSVLFRWMGSERGESGKLIKEVNQVVPDVQGCEQEKLMHELDDGIKRRIV